MARPAHAGRRAQGGPPAQTTPTAALVPSQQPHCRVRVHSGQSLQGSPRGPRAGLVSEGLVHTRPSPSQLQRRGAHSRLGHRGVRHAGTSDSLPVSLVLRPLEGEATVLCLPRGNSGQEPCCLALLGRGSMSTHGLHPSSLSCPDPPVPAGCGPAGAPGGREAS